MRFTHADNAVSLVTVARPLGGATVVVQDGSAFAAASPTADVPMRLSIFVGPDGQEVLLTVLKCVGVAGGTLAVAGTLDGYADRALLHDDVQAGLVKAACVPHRGDMTALGDRIDALREQVEAIEATPGPEGPPGPDGRTPAVAFGTGPDADRLTIDGVPTGPHLTGPQGDQGDQGPSGGQGPPGTPGTVWRQGFGPPSGSPGVDGDLYLEQATGDVYRRAAGSYGVVANLRGPEGPPGSGSGGDSLPSQAGQAGKVLGTNGASASWVDYVDPDELAAALSGKADASALTTLAGVVGTKAAASDLTALQTTVAGKADASAVGTLTGLINAKADDSAVVKLAGAQAIAGRKTLTSPIARGDGTNPAFSIQASSSADACTADASGNFFPFTLRFLLAKGVDLAAGSGLTGGLTAEWPGVISEVTIRARINGPSGGFTLAVAKNGAALASQVVSASTTSVVTIPAGSLSSAAVAKGDLFDLNVSAPGTGVQSVEVTVVGKGRHA